MSHFETNSCFSAGDVAKALMASFQGSHAVLIFLRRRKFPLSYPCYHPQYVSTIFKISPLLVDKSYVTSLGFSENSAPPDLNRFSRHSLLKLLWDVVGIPSFFPRWIRRAQFCWSSARRKWRIWCVTICWTSSHLTVSERLRPTDDGKVSRVHWPIEYPWRMIFMAYIITQYHIYIYAHSYARIERFGWNHPRKSLQFGNH